ncbi:MAG: ABC transporter substrate-binding protein [bacterium]|nr:ABC transporter substrate-binding protein [Candidatus Sumerlaeota bacterium]
MLPALRHLWLGILLIAAASLILLASDLKQRHSRETELPRLAVFIFATQPGLTDSRQGAIDALTENGFIDGKSIRIQHFNSENDLPTAHSIARRIIDAGFKAVITFSTPCLQAMAQANQDGKVIHVFGTVTDPSQSGVGVSRDDPSSHPRHLTGYGTFQPVREAFRLARVMNPELKTVGVVWNPGETCSQACLMEARDECSSLGITLVEAQVDSSMGVREAAQSLTSRGVQALWLGGDNTVEIAADSLASVAEAARIPLFTNSHVHARIGALFGLGADYYEVGKATGSLAARILRGTDPASIPIGRAVPMKLAINPNCLSKSQGAWRIPETVREQAAIVIDEKGVEQNINKQQEPASGSAQSDRGGPPSMQQQNQTARIKFIKFVDEVTADDAQKGVFDELPKCGLAEGRDYVISAASAQGDLATLSNLMDAAAGGNADLIITATTPALQTALKRAGALPIVFTAVADPVRAGAGETFEKHLPNVTGISVMSDFEGMARLVKECLPHARRIGTLFAPAEVNSVAYREALTRAAQKAGLEVVTVGVHASNEVSDAALSLCSKNIDAICQVSDNVSNVGFTSIVNAARKDKIPLFTFVSGHAKTGGGAAAALARDYEQAGRDAAHMAARVIRGENPAAMPFQLVSRTRLIVNLSNAAFYGLIIPPSVLERADEVIKP